MRDGWLRQLELSFDIAGTQARALADRAFSLLPQQSHNLQASWISERFEGREKLLVSERHIEITLCLFRVPERN